MNCFKVSMLRTVYRFSPLTSIDNMCDLVTMEILADLLDFSQYTPLAVIPVSCVLLPAI